MKQKIALVVVAILGSVLLLDGSGQGLEATGKQLIEWTKKYDTIIGVKVVFTRGCDSPGGNCSHAWDIKVVEVYKGKNPFNGNIQLIGRYREHSVASIRDGMGSYIFFLNNASVKDNKMIDPRSTSRYIATGKDPEIILKKAQYVKTIQTLVKGK